MNNIYLIYGDEDYFIDKEINKIKEKYKGYDLINYDMLETNISSAIEDASMISLFSSNKLIICNNCIFCHQSPQIFHHQLFCHYNFFPPKKTEFYTAKIQVRDPKTQYKNQQEP